MKRHASIIPLSKDHHFGLLCCWKVRQGVKLNVDPARIGQYVHHFWQDHLQDHFREEETILFNALENDPQCNKAVEQHRELTAAVQSLPSGISTDNLLQFAALLDEHIRFEERVLFPFLEQKLSEEQLAAIGKSLEELHTTKTEDDYPDEFWVKDSK